MTTLITGRIEKFKNESNFKSLKDFNNNIEMFLAIHKKDFTKTEFILFRRLTKYSAKVAGVSNVSIKKVLAAVKLKDFKLGVSESSFQRMKRKAIKLGILEVKATNRANASRSSNLWVFKRFNSEKVFDVSERSVETTPIVSDSATIDTCTKKQKQVEALPVKGKEFDQLTGLKTDTLSKTNTLNIYKERKAETIVLMDHTYVSSNLPVEFVDAVKPFYSNPKDIYALYSRLSIAVSKTGDKSIMYSHMDAFIKAFKESVYRQKQGKIHSSFFGYVYKAWAKIANKVNQQQKEAERLYNQMINQPRDPNRDTSFYYNWLEEDSELLGV